VRNAHFLRSYDWLRHRFEPPAPTKTMLSTDYPALEAWLTQFGADAPVARQLAAKFHFVSAQKFTDKVSDVVRSRYPANELCALFIEREPRKVRGGKALRIYKEAVISRGRGQPKHLRATGSAQPVVRSPRSDRQEVGSEGVVAALATQIARAEPTRFFVQPSAEEIRRRKIRHIVVMTDLVGSGQRTTSFLDSLWSVRTLRSWRSGRQVSFSVVSYTGTAEGLAVLGKHRCAPLVHSVVPCPTISSEFSGAAREDVINLCEKYGERLGSDALGYRKAGVLLAFAHGCPNNAPSIFHKRSKRTMRPWEPLFPGRTALSLSQAAEPSATDRLAGALESLGEVGLPRSPTFSKARLEKKRMLTLLAAVKKGHRSKQRIALAADLRLWEVEEAMQRACRYGVLDSANRLTRAGVALLRALRLEGLESSEKAPPAAPASYYPFALRAP
jgi:hypothetical protein